MKLLFLLAFAWMAWPVMVWADDANPNQPQAGQAAGSAVVGYALAGASNSPKQLAITFSQNPLQHMLFSHQHRTDLLLQNLKRAKVKPVMFFVTTSLTRFNQPSRLKRLGEAGHLLASNGYEKRDINEAGFDWFSHDFSQADQMLRQLKNFRPYYRFPQLRQPDESELMGNVRQLMAEQGYNHGYVTIPAQDYLLNQLFTDALLRRKNLDFEQLKALYVTWVREQVNYYDGLALQLLQRSPRHILQLGENDLSAMFIDDVVAALRADGWQIISPEQAYQDALFFMTPEAGYSRYGRIAALAMARGDSGSFTRYEMTQQTKALSYWQAERIEKRY